MAEDPAITPRASIAVAFSRGVGSVLDVAPASRCWRFVPRETFNERLRSDFRRVGGALRYSMDSMKEEKPRDVAQKKGPA